MGDGVCRVRGPGDASSRSAHDSAMKRGTLKWSGYLRVKECITRQSDIIGNTRGQQLCILLSLPLSQLLSCVRYRGSVGFYV